MLLIYPYKISLNKDIPIIIHIHSCTHLHTWYNTYMTKTTNKQTLKKYVDELAYGERNKLEKQVIRKLKIKSTENFNSQAPHTNFAEEIYQSQKTDKFLDRIFYTGCAMLAVLAITYRILK